MLTYSTRLNRFTESVISEMNLVAEKYDAINLASGYPDFNPPVELLQAAERALHEGHNQYTIPYGSLRFRQALAEKHSHFSGIPIDPEEHITVTCGSTEAMYATLISLLNPGDPVIIFSPFYENYPVDTLLLDARPLYIPLQQPGFALDPADLRQALEQGARVIIICNPSNPSGKVFTLAEFQTIANLAQEYNAFVITDEVYEHIVYTPNQHIHLSSLPGMFERTITCSSLSKTYAITGWRLGYTIAPPQITTGIRKVHEYLTLGAAAPLQEAAISGLRFPDSYYAHLIEEYDSRRRLFLNALDQTGLEYIPPQGAYFVLVDISPFGFKDDKECCLWMAKQIGVAAVPGSCFFHVPNNQYVRFNFAKSFDLMAEAGQRVEMLKHYL